MVLVFKFFASLLFKSLMPIDVSRDVFLPCSFFFFCSFKHLTNNLILPTTLKKPSSISNSTLHRWNIFIVSKTEQYQRRNTQLSSSAIKLASSFFILFFFESPRIHGNRSLSRPMHRSRCFVVSTLSRYWSEPQHMSILTLSRFSRSLPFCRA